MNDDSIMPFGIHKGKKMANVPDEYLLYLYENSQIYGELKEYIKENLGVIKSQIELKNKSNNHGQ
jgi:uncharacterized protein (DUF3820 family)